MSLNNRVKYCYISGHSHIVEFLITRSVFTKKEKVEALELLGATYVDRKRDLTKAAKCWSKCLQERESGEKDTGYTQPVSAYNYASRFNSEEDLQALIDDPDQMRMQALLLRENILGPMHPDTSYYIRYRGAVYADSGDFDRCITLWKYALHMQQKHLDVLNQLTHSSFLSFTELFSFMATSADHLCIRMSPPGVFFDDLLLILDQCISEIKRGRDHLQHNCTSDKHVKEKEVACFNRYLVILIHLMSLINKYSLDNHIEEDKLKAFEKSFSRLAILNFTNRHTNQTLLHLACSKDISPVGRYPIYNFPQTSLILKLLKAGFSANKTDNNGELLLSNFYL